MEREGEHSYHHALFCLGRMACQRERMISEVLAIHICDLQHGFINGCVRSHRAGAWVRVRGVPR